MKIIFSDQIDHINFKNKKIIYNIQIIHIILGIVLLIHLW
jgi:hypothetical protein